MATDTSGDGAAASRHTSGLTSRLILAYVERQKGREGAREVLRRCGLEDAEDLLQDENHWFDFETKIRLFQAASEVLGDPDVALHIGGAALDLNVASGVKLALRAFGSPRLVYANVGRASAKFTWAHRWEVLDIGSGHARLRYSDSAGVGYHHFDCQYNRGLLACAPEMFGLPRAEIQHEHCAVDGADACIYDVRWAARGIGLPTAALVVGLTSTAFAAAAALVAPPLMAAAAAVPAAGAALVWRQASIRLRRRVRGLERQLQEQKEVAGRLSTSLQDLVSDLRLQEVLDKIVANARAAVGGKEFALLLREGEQARCRSSSGLSSEATSALEEWAALTGAVFVAPMILDHLGEVPVLSKLAASEGVPFGSLCAAPLIFKDEHFGALVAMAHGPEAFLPRDATVIESYAAQAAVALSNAHLVERLERLASQDPLTGLLNHREFHEAVDRELSRCKRYGGHFSVVLIDLDGFKQVNDRNGHAKGDEVLRKVAQTIAEVSRSCDSVFRIGGDEFAIVAPDTTVPEAASLAERLQVEVAGLSHGVTMSFGAGEWPQDGPTKDLLLLRADSALYAQKREADALKRSGSADPEGEGTPLRSSEVGPT
jgi:diguanylate cyclase (GGDEF)-like protein